MKTEKTFAGIEAKYASFESAEILLQSIPYDGTSTIVAPHPFGVANVDRQHDCVGHANEP